MSPPEPTNIRNRAFLTAWGMVTLILVVCIAFLLVEMRQQGYTISPLAKQALSQREIVTEFGSELHQVQLYFGDLEKNGLIGETRQLELTTDTVSNCKKVLEAIIQGPQQMMSPVLNPGVQVRAIYLEENGNLIVDFSREIELERNASPTSDWIMVQSLVNSIVQESVVGTGGTPVNSLRILVEGSVPFANFPSHIDVSEVIKPEEALLLGRSLKENRV